MSAQLQSILALRPAVEFIDVAIPGMDEPIRLRAMRAGDLMKLRSGVLAAPKEDQESQAAILSIFLTAVNDDGSRLFESVEQVAGLPVPAFTALSQAVGGVISPDEAAKN